MWKPVETCYNIIMEKTRYARFVQNFMQDAWLFVFLLVVLSGFRATFLVLFSDTLLPDTPGKDIALTLWYGLRISLKTAGACVLPAFVFGTLLSTAWPKWNGEKFRFYWACFVLFVFSALFQMRIPYYQEFHSAFSPFMFNMFHDDVGAIVSTAIDQYNAVWRVIGILICSAVLGYLVRGWFKLFPSKWQQPLLSARRPWVVVTCICLFVAVFAVFVRYGGAFSFHKSIYWKNAARLNQHILNEAVLDDIQAVYRAKSLYKDLRKSAIKVSAQEVRTAAARLMGKSEYTAEDLLPLLAQQAAGGQKPDHIVVIVAETYMMWPLLDNYASYPLAQGVRKLLKRSDAKLVSHFLPASNGTMFGLTSVLLGIPELNLYASSRQTAQKPYETGLPEQLKKQGYKAQFFYGGFPSWNEIGTFINNQGFDKSFYAADFSGEANVWGVADRDFLQKVPEMIGDEPSFNVVLTSSNHPPYRVDMSREPDLPTVKDFENMLPAKTADKELVASRMWHFAYADKYLAEFVEAVLAKYPNSLVVITGDHADRWTLTASPSDYERIAVPLILIGRPVAQKRLPAKAAGSHMDLAATLLELVLAKNTPYYALGHNILATSQEGTPFGVSAYYWITANEMGRLHENKTELLPGVSTPLDEEKRAEVLQRARDLRTVAAWRIMNGVSLRNN